MLIAGFVIAATLSVMLLTKTADTQLEGDQLTARFNGHGPSTGYGAVASSVRAVLQTRRGPAPTCRA